MSRPVIPGTRHQASNWLSIDPQRHYKPNRRFPLLQNHDKDAATELPYGYPIVTIAATIPPLWHRVMNPRARE